MFSGFVKCLVPLSADAPLIFAAKCRTQNVANAHTKFKVLGHDLNIRFIKQIIKLVGSYLSITAQSTWRKIELKRNGKDFPH